VPPNFLSGAPKAPTEHSGSAARGQGLWWSGVSPCGLGERDSNTEIASLAGSGERV